MVAVVNHGGGIGIGVKFRQPVMMVQQYVVVNQ